MKIEDLINLTMGELKSEPTIHSINSATVYLSKVEQGDLFISDNKDDIYEAIDKGAYAIIYSDSSIEITDREVAWILVEDIQKASFKILRFIALSREVVFYYFTDIELTFFKMFVSYKKSIVILSEEWRKIFETVLNSNSKLFIGTDKELLLSIKPDVQILNPNASCEIISDTLFRTTFKVGGFLYQEKEITPSHVDYVQKVFEFCQKHNLLYDFDKVRYTKHFLPVFIDSKLNKIHSSKSEKVVIFTDNLRDIVLAREFVKYNGRWIKTVVLTPPKVKIEGFDKPIWYESSGHAREILKNTHFNYAFVFGSDKSLLDSLKEEASLF
ncbi:MAG: hypothetical protein IE878_02610 [Epsilonproteobacteria bacterium]|nr:hypothetical protein [Campylobacterota bacterium]MBD3839264.1 hypothetical protein [Campylobacterota bacterium]